MSKIQAAILRIVQHGLDLNITNEGYNNVLFKVSDYSVPKSKQVVLPNDHLNDEKIGSYLDLLIDDVLEVKKQDMKERGYTQPFYHPDDPYNQDDMMDGLYCEDCRQSLETCNCNGRQERDVQSNDAPKD